MDLTTGIMPELKQVANESLTVFKTVADTCRESLGDSLSPDLGSFACVNTFTNSTASNELKKISDGCKANYTHLAKEPVLVRVTGLTDEGEEETYYICRETPPTIKGFTCASYKSPIGRLASLNVGAEGNITTPEGGKTLEIIEKFRFHPFLENNQWDSRNTEAYGEKFSESGYYPIESLRSLLAEADSIEEILAEDQLRKDIFEGTRRNIIGKMELRDQPILDQHQDEIFRLPLDARLLILGSPGTGKTTTLIRRLSQKLDEKYLNEDEKDIIDSVKTEIPHAQNWLMFTPTELLKQYLKEAFNREHVPAPDSNVKTWVDYRKALARNTLGILKTTSSNAGGYTLKESAKTLNDEVFTNLVGWFEDFNAWYHTTLFEELHQSAENIANSHDDKIATVGKRLISTLKKFTKWQNLPNISVSFVLEVHLVQKHLEQIKGNIEKRIEDAVKHQRSKNRNFLEELAEFISHLSQNEIEDQDDFEDQDDEAQQPLTTRKQALDVYKSAVKAQARAVVNESSLRKDTRNAKVIQWLGNRGLSKEDYKVIGNSLVMQSSARRFVKPILADIPKKYRVFRRQRQQESQWYFKDGFTSTDLHPLELDTILLMILRNASEFFLNKNILRNIDKPSFSYLREIEFIFRNQIFVDEATDFSPIQLACMANLSHPQVRSFFACGDFNQRLTTWGTRSEKEIHWIFSNTNRIIDVKKINVAYRQSSQLNELARSVILAFGGQEQDVILPKYVNNDCVSPVLLENATDHAIVDWLALRIQEIEKLVKKLPSIAILVCDENDVEPLANELNSILEEVNIQVIACHKGQTRGQDTDVRVFDVQHIKGLEFEAVFFIGIDRLAHLQSQLFDKYLYVGATRAATYLGMTCTDSLPDAIVSLRHLFVNNWKI
ncbi:hypothetical protein CKO12_06035 [Chromatium okenii]|uniref:ATP-binding domain-containing protein n=1 Tax=Chromatium okenii TaxID=61644 RepID=UPI0019044B95|nr:ATP-binding domain-containing protein [Chromatium okenii]MBK1641439.1 hypothetical protein [Chromatium okenii]